jgi:hypothetical protein
VREVLDSDELHRKILEFEEQLPGLNLAQEHKDYVRDTLLFNIKLEYGHDNFQAAADLLEQAMQYVQQVCDSLLRDDHVAYSPGPRRPARPRRPAHSGSLLGPTTLVVLAVAAAIVLIAFIMVAKTGFTSSGPAVASSASQASSSAGASNLNLPAGIPDGGHWRAMTAQEVLKDAGLSGDYHFFTGGEIPVSAMAAHEVAWVVPWALNGGPGHYKVDPSFTVEGAPFDFAGGNSSFGPAGTAQLLLVMTDHGLHGIYFPSSCGGSQELGADGQGSGGIPIEITGTFKGACAYVNS